MKVTTLYDQNMNLVAYLENAFKISYTRKFNDLWEASFSLPADDPKNDVCQPFCIVEIYDGDERVDLFRIIQPKKSRSNGQKVMTYQCEHVLATLVDDVLDGYHQIGNLGVHTSEVINYLLGFQTIKKWVFGHVDPDLQHQYEYKWEKEKTLLGPLFSITQPFAEDYHWTWDTTVFPWVISVDKPKDDNPCAIRYGKNLKGIEQNIDATTVVTRLIPYGYGEGVNQLDITSVNPTGKRYIDADAATIKKYGIIQDIWVDKRFEIAKSLYDTAVANLKELKVPQVSYKADGAYIYQITKDSVDKFEEGRLVNVYDETLNLAFQARVITVERPDIKGDPGAVTIEIANKVPDVTMDLGNIKNRQDIHDVYAQGAVNMLQIPMADNCDPDHPLVMPFVIPDEFVNLNSAYVFFKCSPFRGYTKGMKSAGQEVVSTTSGPSSRTTSGPSSKTTSGSSSRTTTAGGGGTTATSSNSGPELFINTLKPNNEDGAVPSLIEHTHPVVTSELKHTHTVSVPSHTHGMDHTHNMEHTHEMDHTHKIDITIPGHTHPLEFGIWEGPVATKIDIYVDDNHVGTFGQEENNIDIVPFMSLDSDGKIDRSVHEIKIVPNDLSRISGSIVTQFFMQSRGDGIY